jgi:UDP-glucuronate decarboxylase
MSRILVTGGAGFLGSHLVERLLNEGHDVTVADNFHTGREKNLVVSPKLRVIRHDVAEKLDVDCEQIFHLACPASPPHYQADPIKTLDTCYLGTKNVLELAWKNKARVMLASTSEVYGDPLEHPQRESYWGHVNPNGIRACYDEGKRIGETLAFEYHRKRGVDIRVARIFNTYGPRMLADDGRVVSNFVMQALRGEALTMYGEGQQTRSFCYVDDLIAGFLALMGQTETVGPVNLGNPGEFTMAQLAALVLEKTGSKSKITYMPLPKDDPARRKPDISVAQKSLKWNPSIPLADGLNKTIAYFRAEMQS